VLLRGERWDNARAWLYRVASRLATDDHRRRKLLEWLPLLGAEPDLGPGVETTVSHRLDVQAALDALPPKYRVPLVLHAYAGCTVAEIAQTLGLSESGVKSRLSRARAKFRQAYGQEEDR
jgi:RNA polymerase sigma factor (sigma-70 family)